ncbi:complement C1q-like protein 4 [Mercenaria mercenaria]|uniref:complement C1q-like protein 4 n=1 Tax=Mercenaria mercenaria TaxID=6596 RepID=UPI00234E373A|nr:complement C1q-like protein 4 [Mercenaria mercenaria]
MDKLLRQLHDMKSNLSSLIINNRRQISDNGIQLGFSLQNVNKSTSSHPLKFTTVRFNSGNMFNMSSGKFVCKRAGLYFFSTTIVREPGITQSYCSIVVNHVNLQTTVGYGSSTTGYSSGSTVLVYHLNIGDRVFVDDCYGADHIAWTSSFSGFLIVPDQ